MQNVSNQAIDSVPAQKPSPIPFPHLAGGLILVAGIAIGMGTMALMGNRMLGTAHNAAGVQTEQITPRELDVASKEASGKETEAFPSGSPGKKSQKGGTDFYSYEYPYVGDYCNGCYGGISGRPQGTQVSVITGGHDTANEDDGESWLIVQATFEGKTQLTSDYWGIPAGPFVATLEKLSIGETAEFGKISYTYIEDIKLDGKPVRRFSGISGVSPAPRDMLMFTIDSTTHFVAVDVIGTRYSNVFPMILDTFTWKSAFGK